MGRLTCTMWCCICGMSEMGNMANKVKGLLRGSIQWLENCVDIKWGSVGWSGDQTWNIPGGLLVSTVVCSVNDPSHHVVEKGEYQVKLLKDWRFVNHSTSVDQPVVYGWFEVVWKVWRGAGEFGRCCAGFFTGHRDGLWAEQLCYVGVKAGVKVCCDGIVTR